MSNEELFKQEMRDKGLVPSERIIANGKVHRFHVTGDKQGTKNGWYKFSKIGGFASGAYGCWKRGIIETWSSKSPKSMTTKEKAAYTKIKKHCDKDQERSHIDCRKRAKAFWNKATKDGIDKHDYVIKKGIIPYGARVSESNTLLIRVHDIDWKLQGMQTINPDGLKIFLKGTAKKQNFSFLSEKPGKEDTLEAGILIFCEGWATGCSLKEATGLSVVVAFDAGNLMPVAEAWRARFPKHKFIIAGDDDHATDGNPGKMKAIEAAKSVKGIPVFPVFIDATDKTDFNDMHMEQGLEAVKALVSAARAKDPKDVYYEIWPEPIPLGAFGTPPLSFKLLPKTLARFCKAVTKNTQTPRGMSIMIGLAIISTCLQKRFEVSPYGDNYKEPVNIMVIVALDPASRKSAVINEMGAPINFWENEQFEALKEKASQVRHEREMIMKSIESIKSSVCKADTTEEARKEALKEIKRLEKSMPEEIIIPHLWTDDVTMERLQNLMVENGERVAIVSDEGGVLEVIAGLYSGGKSNINIILQSHAGSPVRVQRQGRSVKMDKPALTIGLAVQPKIITDLAHGNKAGFRGKGLLARFLYCIPKSTVGSRDISKREPIPEGIATEYHKMIHRLLSIKPIYNQMGKEQPRILTLAPDALKIWLEFSQGIESKQGQFGEYHSIQDWTGKLPGAALRIAGLCHVVEHGKKNRVINEITMRRAIELAKLLIYHAKAAFGMMGNDPAITDAKAVLQWLKVNNVTEFRRGNLHRALHGRFPRVDRLKTALNVLVERHIISDPEEKPTGRRPEIVYRVNPAIFRERDE